MLKVNSAKIFLSISILLFVAKPFLGFSMFSRLHPPPQESIFVKAFSKRKVEFDENSSLGVSSIQKKLAEPPPVFVLFGCLLSLLFPVAFSERSQLTYAGLGQRHAQFVPILPAWLVNGNLTI
jgi:hypothetical protein